MRCNRGTCFRVFLQILALRGTALRAVEEAIQLERHGALRAPRDDNPFEDTS